jgi:hypothetical protein
MDYFLDDTNCVARLVSEYERYGSLIVAYDYDSTVFDYHGKGLKYDDVIDLLRHCRSMGFHLTVFTSCNDDRFPEIRVYLTQIDIPFDGINETPDFIPFQGRKVYYNILLDDRAGLSAAYNQLWAAIMQIRAIKHTKNLTDVA